jgi:DNA-binding IclR family transcriptional regulator
VVRKEDVEETNLSKHSVASVLRALAILEFVGASYKETGVTEVSAGLNLHKSTVSRLMSTLASRGFLRQNHATGRYSLGLRIAALGSICLSQIDVRQQARPYLEELMEASGEAVHLGILDDGHAVYIDKVESSQVLTMRSRVGASAPIHCTALGKAMCAYLPEATVREWLAKRGMKQHTANTIVNPDDYIAHLATVQALGYASDDEEHEEGIRCIAVPIMDHTGRPVAAVSISGPTVRMSREKVREILPSLIRAGRELSASMGFDMSRTCSSK